MGYQPSDLHEKYAEYKSKYGDKYKLGMCDGRYEIRHKFTKLKKWVSCVPIIEQPQVGWLSIIGLGDYKYSNEEWAKKCYIEFVNIAEKIEDNSFKEI